MPTGKTVRIKVKTSSAIYEGDILIPEMRKRVSDVLNDEERQFINLTDVHVRGKDGEIQKASFVSINKVLIEAIYEEDGD
jgi:recombinational DNA repair protein RecT